MDFNEKFIFGAATSAYQSEGAVNENGRGKVCWDVVYHKPESKFNADIASDFYHRYEEDLKNAKRFGINGIRISIAWSRIIPDGNGNVSSEGIEYYHKLIDSCIKNGVEPFVTLHHFDTPLKLFENGDWLNNDTIDSFIDYCRICFEEFGDKVKKWITINEPYSIAAGQYIIGHFPPCKKYDVASAIKSMHSMTLAHCKVVKMYKDMNFDGEIGMVHILESKYAYNQNDQEDILAANREDVIANRFVLEGLFNGKYSKETLETINEILEIQNEKFELNESEKEIMRASINLTDFLGINYYSSHFIKNYDGKSNIVHNGGGIKGTSVYALEGVGQRLKSDDIETTSWDWPIYPKGLEDMILNITKVYKNCKKIYITENGIGLKEMVENSKIDDFERIEYIQKHLSSIRNANEMGANVCGYFIWSLMDVFSWTNNYSKRYGLFYVDFETQKRYAKLSAYYYKELSKTKEINVNLKKVGNDYANS